VLHWFCSEGWPDSEHITPHFHVLLIVPAKYFEARSRLCIGQAEWRVMWEERLRADGRRIADIRVTENPDEVAK
jgi:plasmid rolling circle replication initiator protein Rep